MQKIRRLAFLISANLAKYFKVTKAFVNLLRILYFCTGFNTHWQRGLFPLHFAILMHFEQMKQAESFMRCEVANKVLD